MKRNAKQAPSVDPVALAKADAAALNASQNETYESGNGRIRAGFLSIFALGSVALVSYVDTLKDNLSGFAALTLRVTVANMRRIALGCADAAIAAKVRAAFEAGKKPQDVIKEAGVPSVTSRGRPTASTKDSNKDPLSIACEAFDALPAATVPAFLRYAFSKRVATIKDPKARVAAAAAVEAIANAA